MRVVAIDQGTTSTKAVLLDDDGGNQTLDGVRHKQIMPAPGHVEHDAAELLANVRALVERGARAGATGIALANQGETIVAWDRRTGAPLCNAVVWQDQRTATAVDKLAEDGLAGKVKSLSGLPLDPYFSASKLRWILDHVQEAKNVARSGALGLGTSDSYFIERLTGRYATDVTTASRTSLMNLATCRWDEELCAIFGLPIELLPEILDDAEPIGNVNTEGGRLTLYNSVVDQVASLYGHGCRAPGDGKITVGTGAFALVITGFESPREVAEGVVPTAAWRTPRGRAYAADGGVYTAAAAIEWLMRLGLIADLAEVDAVSGPPAASRNLYFVPALNGLACPHWDRTATGLFIGLDAATGRQDMIKAVLEGVALRIAEVVDTLRFAQGADRPISLDGGLTRSRYFLGFLADITGRRLAGRGDAEVTALGAGALGLALAGGRDAATYRLELGKADLVEPGELPTLAAAWRERFDEARRRASGWRQ